MACCRVDTVPVGKVIGLSFVTFGVYFFVFMYRHSAEVQALRSGARGDWRLLFWLGFVTLGVTWIVLYVLNERAVQDHRRVAGLPDSGRGTAALTFATLASLLFISAIMTWAALGFVPAWLLAVGGTFGLAASIWATHVNDTFAVE